MTSSLSKQDLDRTIVVVSRGAGKATFIGSMLFKCGIDMLTLETLEKKGLRAFNEITKELKAMGKAMFFYTPKYTVTLEDSFRAADAVILIVAPDHISEQLSDEAVTNQASDMKPFFENGRAVILINKLDLHEWSESVFSKSVQDTKIALSGLGISTENIKFVPTSALQGHNLIELSNKCPWYCQPAGRGEQGQAVVTVLDSILS
ncbi:Nn.00g074380.m01.CDS01 [Neocucurbitaria sp. VM-36]